LKTLNIRDLNLNVKKEFLKKRTMNPEILNKPIRTENEFKTDKNFLEVENTYKKKKSGIFDCCKDFLNKCKKKKNSHGLLESGVH